MEEMIPIRIPYNLRADIGTTVLSGLVGGLMMPFWKIDDVSKNSGSYQVTKELWKVGGRLTCVPLVFYETAIGQPIYWGTKLIKRFTD